MTDADVIASIVEQQPPLPHGLDGAGSILQYVEYMSGKNQNCVRDPGNSKTCFEYGRCRGSHLSSRLLSISVDG